VSGLVDAEATAEATDATDVAKAAGSASFTVKAYPAAIQGKLGDFLGGYRLSGSDLLVSGNVTFRGKDVTLKGDLRTRDLALQGPALGPRGATLKDVTVLCDLDGDGGTLDAGIRDLTLECGVIDVALRASEASARVNRVVAKLSGSRRGDEIVAKADIKVRDVTALSPRLGRRARSRPASRSTATRRRTSGRSRPTRSGPSSASPRSTRGSRTPRSPRACGPRPRVHRFEERRSRRSREAGAEELARAGDGTLKITNLGKAGMAADGRFDFGGEVGPLVDLAKVVVPDLKDATASGTWQFGAAVATKGSRIEVSPQLRIRQMSLHGRGSAARRSRWRRRTSRSSPGR